MPVQVKRANSQLLQHSLLPLLHARRVAACGRPCCCTWNIVITRTTMPSSRMVPITTSCCRPATTGKRRNSGSGVLRCDRPPLGTHRVFFQASKARASQKEVQARQSCSRPKAPCEAASEGAQVVCGLAKCNEIQREQPCQTAPSMRTRTLVTTLPQQRVSVSVADSHCHLLSISLRSAAHHQAVSS